MVSLKTNRMRRLIALLCIVIVVFATVVPAAASHFSEVLAPLWVVLFPVPVPTLLRPAAECRDEQPVALLATLAPRAPPLLH
jgi:hypothetical protein